MASSRSQAYAKRRRQAQQRRKHQADQLQVETLEPKILLAGNTSTEFAQIVSVVPQPLVRSGSGLSQATNQIDVYFNDVDLIDSSTSAENRSLYQLIYTNDTIDNGDDRIFNPAAVNYSPGENKAVLTFSNDIGALGGNGAFRLRVNTSQNLQTEPLEISEVEIYADDRTDAGSSLLTAASATGVLPGDRLSGAITIDGTIEPQLLGTSFPGSSKEPGMRQFTSSPDEQTGITTYAYNFQGIYGESPSGAPLFNAITENQKDRAREVLDMYSREFGLSFYETENEGITIATGSQVGEFLPDTYVSSPANSDDSTGGQWYASAMQGISEILGFTSEDLVRSRNLIDLEPVLPGDVGLVQGQHIFRPDSIDIDLYRFQLFGSGQFSAETIAERLSDSSLLDTSLTLFDVEGNVISRNDDYFSEDSFIDLELDSGTYFIGVSASGNEAYDPVIEDTGRNGTSEGDYKLRLDFKPASTSTLITPSGSALDGDGDGAAGGVFNFWFEANTDARTIYVDKSFAGTGDGSLSSPFSNLSTALNAASDGGRDIVRILGNGGADGDINTLGDNLAYELGFNNFSRLEDGGSLTVPKGVTVMIDEGAIFKMRSSYVLVGSTTTSVDRSGAALQVLGTPNASVIFTSSEDEAIGVDKELLPTSPDAGEWGGIIFGNDVDRDNFRLNTDGSARDFEGKGIFLNHVGQADLRYGGGNVTIDSVQRVINPIHLTDARPTLSYNDISLSADAAMSANPDSFEESRFHAKDSLGFDYQVVPFTSDYDRVGPDIRGNNLFENTTNAISIRIDTLAGNQLERMTVTGRFDDTDIVHALKENLLVASTPGGPLQRLSDGTLEARLDAQLVVDPGIVLKVEGARIEAAVSSQIIAEGTEEDPVIITSINDNRFGGTTEESTAPSPGDWSGIYVGHSARLSIDNAVIAYAGGVSRIPGSSAAFNAIELHQAEAARITNSTIENNAAGVGGNADELTTTRAGRGSHAPGAVFIRGSQPVIIGNTITGTEGTEAPAITIDPNSLSAPTNIDLGRWRGELNRVPLYDDNHGPLIRENVIEGNVVNGIVVRTGVIETETVWDDSDIAHIMFDPIVIPNAFSAGGVRLESNSGQSLVVKLDGNEAGFVVTGNADNIADRIGGALNVVGLPGSPVVITSLRDNTVGAGLRSDGTIQTNTSEGEFARPERQNEAGSFQIDVNFGAAILDHPDIMEGVQRAARLWENLIEDPITITIDFELDTWATVENDETGQEVGTFQINPGFDPVNDNPLFIVEPEIVLAPFDQVVQQLKSDARPHESVVQDIPDYDSIDVQFPDTADVNPFTLSREMQLTSANYKAIFGETRGEIPSAFDPREARDGIVTINEGALGFVGTGFAPVFYDFDRSDGIEPQQYDFVGIMAETIGHVMGFGSSMRDVNTFLNTPVDENGVPLPDVVFDREIALTPKDLFRLEPGEGNDDFAGATRVLDPRVRTHVFYDGGEFDPSGLPIALQLEAGDIPLENNLNLASPSQYDPAVHSAETYIGLAAPFEFGVERYISPQDRSVFDLIGYDVIGDAVPGDWRGIEFETYSHDANVGVAKEFEDTNDREGSNRVPSEAQYVGAVAQTASDSDENQRNALIVHGFINNPTDVDVYSFDAIPGTELWIDIDKTSQALDSVVELVDANGIPIARSDNSLAEASGDEDRLFNPNVPSFDLNKSTFLSLDNYSTNPKDAGLRVVVPGNSSEASTFFVRVRSSSENLGVLTGGRTMGQYELQIRTTELDVIPGSGIQFADIRYAVDGVRVTGLPRHSPLTGEIKESNAANDTGATPGNFANQQLLPPNGGDDGAFATPQYVGTVTKSDLAAISISGDLSAPTDVDFYQFTIDQAGKFVLDVDYADGLGRADTSLYLYSAVFGGDPISGDLPAIGDLLASNDNASNVDDLPAPFQGNDLDDLSRGSVGQNDPMLGPIDLGPGEYLVAISAGSFDVPLDVDQFDVKYPDNPLMRVEPITTVSRVAHETFDGAVEPPAELSVLIDPGGFVDYGLADVPLFVSGTGALGTEIYTVDTFQGGLETHVGTVVRPPDTENQGGGDEGPPVYNIFDIALAERQLPTGGRVESFNNVQEYLFGFTQETNDAFSGNYVAIDTGDATLQPLFGEVVGDNDNQVDQNGDCPVGDDCITTYALVVPEEEPEPGEEVELTVEEVDEGVQFEALVLQEIDERVYAGFAIGSRATTNGTAPYPGAYDNILYTFDHETGNALSAPADDREEELLIPPAEDALFGYSQIVERGVLITSEDLRGGPNEDTALIAVGATDADGTSLITDGMTFSILDEDDVATVFEFDTPSDYSIQTDSLGIPLFLKDGDQFEVDGVTFEIESGPVLAVDDVSSLRDGDTIVIGDFRGSAPNLTIELDGDGNVADGNVALSLVGLVEPGDVAARLADLINQQVAFSATAVAVNERVSLTFDNGAISTADGIVVEGGVGNSVDTVAVSIEEFATAEQIATAITSTVGTGELRGNRIGFSEVTDVDFSNLEDRGVFISNGAEPGVGADTTRIRFTVDATASDIATAIADATGGNAFDNVVTVQQGGDARFDADSPFEVEGESPGGKLTGMAFVGSRLYAVSDGGGLYEITNYTSPNDPPGAGAQANYIEQSAQLLGTSFSGLTVGPQEVSGGAYARTLFATDSRGNLHAFNTDGIPQPVFANGATSISTGVPGANGLQFSSSQSNLWNITDQRAGDAGHFGGNSLRFGDIERNIDLPGGTQGSAFSNEIDLSSYTAFDQPSLYFNYFMTAEELEAPVKTDTFRVFVSDDSEASEDKGSWVLVASSDEAALPDGVEPLFNNSFQDVARMAPAENFEPGFSEQTTPYDYTAPNGVRDTFPPIEDEFAPFPPDEAGIEEPVDWFAFPELDERRGTWRQARVDLSQFAGSDSLRLRFDFSTAGSFDLGSLGGVELKTVEGAKLSDGQTFTVDGVTFEIDMGVGVALPAGAGVSDGDVLTLLSTAGDLVDFEFDNDGSFDLANIQVPFESQSNANAVAASLATALTGAGFDISVAFPFDGRLQFSSDQVQNAFVNESSFAITGGGLDLGVANGNVPVSLDLGMSADDVAAVVAEAFVENLGEGIAANYVVTGNTIRLVGDNVSDPGPFGLAVALEGDDRGAFTTPVGSPAYRGLENLYRYYTISEDSDGEDLSVLPFVTVQGDDDEEFPEDFAVQFEGVYVDDIVIGFAARGEESTDLRRDYFFTDPDSFPDLIENEEIRIPNVFAYRSKPLQPNGLDVVTTGPYRLEIRTATEDPSLYPLNQLDRTVDNTALFAPQGVELFDGRIFRLSDGRLTTTFEFNDASLEGGVNPNHVAVNYVPSSTGGAVAASIRDAINTSSLAIDAYTSDGVTAFGVVGTQDPRVNLSSNAVVLELEDPNGIDFVSLSLEGAGNRERNPGQLIVTQSLISNSEGHGVIVQSPARDLPGYTYYDPLGLISDPNTGDYISQPGGAQNLRELNPDNITTGIVISNNVISFNGQGAIKYDGAPSGIVMIPPLAGDLADAWPNGGPLEVWDGLTFSIIDRTGLTRQFEWHDLEQSGGHFDPRTPGIDWDAGNVPVMFARSLYATNPLDECPYAPEIQCEARGADTEVDVADRLMEAIERSNLDVKVFRGGTSEIYIEGAVAMVPSGPAPWTTLPTFIAEVTPGQRPFGRIVNNTLVGLGGQFTDNRVDEVTPLESSGFIGTILREVNDHSDVGIDIGDSAVPTLMNNIIANFELGLSGDVNSLDTVRVGQVFQGNTRETLNLGKGDFAVELDMDDPLFVDLVSGNFYPAEGSRVIDSSVDSLEERPLFETIKSSVGIAPSPILTPNRDVLGQLREDDPSVEPQDGQGRNAFKDRGAIDRVDFVGPTAILQNPRDNDALNLDQDPTRTVVALSPLVNLERFEIEFQDTSQLGGAFDGTGVDPVSLDDVIVLQDGTALVDGVDYFLDFDSTNSVLRAIPTSGSWPAGRTYEIILDDVNDIAGNPVRDNQIAGGVRFTIRTQLGTDFGDARAEYPGASHDIANGFFLGQTVTPDAGDQFDKAASLDGGDDGVLLPAEFIRSEANSITVQASADGVLDAWFDFNANRVFEESEHVFSGTSLVAGANELSVSMPQNSAGGELFARFRFTSEGISTPGGAAPDGEVEDYVVAVEGGALWQNVSNPNDVDDDGFLSPKDVLLVIREIDLARASDDVTRELDDPFVAPNTPSAIGFVDVTGDGFVSPRDVRAVIDAVNAANDAANAAANGNGEPIDDGLVALMTTSLTVDPIGEILENPTVELPVVAAAAPPAAVFDEVFTDDDEELALEIAKSSEGNDARDDAFADLDLFSDDSN